MSTIRTCLACGTEDRDVAMTVIKVAEAEQRVVSVAIVSAEDRRGVQGFDYADVRERFIAEPRCRDKAACRKRALALAEPMDVDPPAPADAAEEGPSWLL